MEQREFARHLRSHMTESEKKLWRQLRAHRLNGEKFRRQQPIGPYVVDFVHFGARLIVEADGGQHNGAPHDEQRDNWLRKQGFTVMRFWNNEIMGNLDGVLATVMNAVTNPPSPPTPLPQGERGDSKPTHLARDAASKPLSPSEGGDAASKPLSPCGREDAASKPLSPCGRGVGERGQKHTTPQHSGGES
ncbi:endonuclease domain-containing protein [Ferrigenium sp. UT5]|uniref:endonuclease domain-containing protein n=1 Tax=Ferrigenium sp. UT5 TaxID=3242105 RepID=UPI0035543A37